MNTHAWRLTLAATALMALVMGSRSAFGLFVSPLNTATGIGLAGISLAAAIGQLGLGVGQPIVGRLAERHGAARVIVIGAGLLAAATAAVVLADSTLTLALVLTAAALAGAAVGSNALLVGEIGRRLPLAQQGLAVGVVGAGGSAGQLLLSPATQFAIDMQGWAFAMLATAALGLLAWPLALAFRGPAPAAAEPAAAAGDGSLRQILRQGRFWCIAGAFGICGFHVGFLGMHMPGVIERCGLPASLAGTLLAVLGAANIAGSVGIGLALQRWRPAPLLVMLYAVRGLAVAALLALPPTAGVLLAFAVVVGLSYMAVLPPISHLLGHHFGVQRLGTVMGVVMLVHQVGSFAGIWLGGWAAEATGSDRLLWMLDIALAALAMALLWPRKAPALLRKSIATGLVRTFSASAALRRIATSSPLRAGAATPVFRGA
jgi:predicted MFS family arabinose efflux permease